MDESLVGRSLGRYRILEPIGAGGMGVVYRAHDERLRRDVAVKVIPPGSLADGASRNRFRREALALSRLNHPSIETVYDFDTQEGQDFLVAEYIEGEDLSRKLASGPLKEEEIIRLAVQLAEGLATAHARAVVHRDLKPGNLRVTPEGQLKVLDFGLAKLEHPEGEGRGAETLTRSEPFAGTLPYMAPEQLRAGTVDARADLYAAGAVIYEMSTGRRPFEERHPADLIDRILHKAPSAPSGVNPDVSPRLDEIVLKCLEKDPDSRYQSAKELLANLRRLASPASAAGDVPPKRARFRMHRALLPAAVAGVVLITGFLALRLGGRLPWGGRGAGAGEIRSLAVLPLENLSGNAGQEYFVDGMTEELTTRLAQIGSLRVIARTSAMRYKGARESVAKIGRELNVDAIVEGSVIRSGDRVRVTAQLVRAATEGHLWAKSYERGIMDVLSLQSELAQAIAQEIQVKLTPAEQTRLRRAGPVNPAAHEAYLHGLYLWNQRTPESIQRSIEFFQEAVAKDPGYALGYSGLGSAYAILPAYRDVPSREVVPKAREAAEKALELDPSLGEAHANLAGIRSDFDYDPVGAEKEFRLAIELAPNSATAHQWYGEFLTHMGRSREAMGEFARAAEVDPLSPIASAMMADAYYYARQYDQAIASARRTIEMFPDFKRTHMFLFNIYLAQGKYEEAIDEHDRALPDKPQTQHRAAFRAGGPRGYWMKDLELRLQQRKSQYVASFRMALPYANLGDRDKAFYWLERAYEDKELQLVGRMGGPQLDSLRSDPRYDDLLKRVGISR